MEMSHRKEMDGTEGFEDLFCEDITDDYLTESFKSQPVKFENLFEESGIEQLDQIIPDISLFLDTEITELVKTEDIVATDDIVNLNLENVCDNNNNTKDDEKIDFTFSLGDDLDLGIDRACQIKEELKESPGVERANSYMSELPCDQISTIRYMPEIVEDDTIEIIKDSENKIKIMHHNGANTIEKIKNYISDESETKKNRAIDHNKRVLGKNLENKKWEQSQIRKEHTKDCKSYHLCDLCPFKTKEKSIFRMHQAFVHKINGTTFGKKISKGNSETIGSRHRPASSKLDKDAIDGCTKPKTIAKGKPTWTINNPSKKYIIKKFKVNLDTPASKDLIVPKLPTIQTIFPGTTGLQFNSQQHAFDHIAFPGDTNKVGRRAISNGSGYRQSILKPYDGRIETKTIDCLHTLQPSVKLCMPSTVLNVVSCQVISPSSKRTISILPKSLDCQLNTFQQTNENLPRRSNERLLRNFQERLRRSELKQALESVKVLVPKLMFMESPSQITILNETAEYVKSLQKTEQKDLEEWEIEKNNFLRLKLKLKSYPL